MLGFPAESARRSVVGIQSDADGCAASHHSGRVVELVGGETADGDGNCPVGALASL